MIKVWVGSTRPAKVKATVAAIEMIAAVDARFRDAIVQPVDLSDVAPTMPMTELAILDGARVRAKTLIDRAVVAGKSEIPIAIGLESGLGPLPGTADRFVLKTWAAVTDGQRWGYGSSGAIVLPEAIARQVVDGRELGDVIDEVARRAVRGSGGAWGVLTLDLIGRGDSFSAALVAALAPFYNPSVYD